MDSPKSLCSLSRTAHNSRTSNPTDYGDDDDTAVKDADDASAVIRSKFNFEQFLEFANRVFAQEDDESIKTLEKFHEEWQHRFSEKDSGGPSRPMTIGPTVLPIRPPRRQAWRNVPLKLPSMRALEFPTNHAAGDGHGGVIRACPPTTNLDINLSKHKIVEENSIPNCAPLHDIDPPRVPAHDASQVTNPSSSSHVYVGTIPLQPCTNLVDHDPIAKGFHQSSRKTLNYVPPEFQKGEILVRPPLSVVEDGVKRWATTAVGYFLGKKPFFHHLKDFVQATWPCVTSVKATSNGFYFFQFKTVPAMEEVIEGGPWLFQGQPIVLQRWVPGMSLRKKPHTEIPVWIRLKHLPMEFWTNEGLSVIASGVGKPLYQDAVTRDCLRIDYARVCIMLNYNSTLPKHVIVMQPNEDGCSEVPCKIDIEYEWIPQKCVLCRTLGHNKAACIVGKKN
ncbi:UNVERIFIED_CONTAM: hypothetical protein Sradi_7199500 [Sesamum radiatum]|uniref:DUF4283 domain-containing protein n=1 Tax=Sesamum radiatum TaxID=300843 RepID=A0AAW2IRD1_SESRA